MAVAWKCDYSGCDNVSVSHDEWVRIEVVPRGLWLFMAIPLVGNLVALIGGLVTAATDVGGYYLCEEHCKWMGE